jgi:benzoyl-CoA reductase/2-hydroxyglutaryl-CoA dehydratase subunit BcrC/BadD/HgdB
LKKDLSLPLVLYVAEFIYLKVYEIKNKNKDLNNVDAFEIFLGTNEFDEISSGKFHDNWFKKLKDNNFINTITGNKVSEETLKLLEIQKNSMVKELIKIPKLYYAKSHYPLELSQRAFNHLWRVCESYELWCKETKQDKLILLGLAS